ncbi:MAG: hypothetical protein HYZ65_02075 [Burkholderiales bacterium]|nr:hypothetical protein [Burkholderiales bacterium]
MKSANKFNTAVLSLAVVVAGCAVAAAFQQGKQLAAVNQMATVTITAQRLTQEQKIAYDMQQSGQAMQTVLVTAKRLGAEEKSAMDRQEQAIQQARIRAQKKAQLLV